MTDEKKRELIQRLKDQGFTEKAARVESTLEVPNAE